MRRWRLPREGVRSPRLPAATVARFAPAAVERRTLGGSGEKIMLLLVLLVEVVVLLVLLLVRLLLGQVVAVPAGEGVVVAEALALHGPVGGSRGRGGSHVSCGMEVVLVGHVLLHGCCGGGHARVRVHNLSPSL